ncbi:MAG: hypothetical protein R3325_16015 [Thermoanaerobaculia bacterium]|nr:hypothetical protein [Thermoanaerobaculia bacterium]
MQPRNLLILVLVVLVLILCILLWRIWMGGGSLSGAPGAGSGGAHGGVCSDAGSIYPSQPNSCFEVEVDPVSNCEVRATLRCSGQGDVIDMTYTPGRKDSQCCPSGQIEQVDWSCAPSEGEAQRCVFRYQLNF